MLRQGCAKAPHRFSGKREGFGRRSVDKLFHRAVSRLYAHLRNRGWRDCFEQREILGCRPLPRKLRGPRNPRQRRPVQSANLHGFKERRACETARPLAHSNLVLGGSAGRAEGTLNTERNAVFCRHSHHHLQKRGTELRANGQPPLRRDLQTP